MNTMYLHGSEEVAKAGFAMQDAARQMANVSSNIQCVLEANQRFLVDWLRRFEELIDKTK